jgi:ankyrin repeat protein
MVIPIPPRSYALSENAVRQNEIEVVERLLQDAEDAGKNVKEIVNVEYGKNHTSPLQIACSEGHFDLVCLLLQKGASINKTDLQYNWTALHCAAQNHIELCEILLRYGADIAILSNRGTSAFHYAAKMFTDDRQQPLQYKVLEEMLQKGQDINQITQSGETPLHHACLEGNAFTTQFLLEHKADITISNKYGENPLHYACRRGVEGVVSLLLEAGADPGAPVRFLVGRVLHAAYYPPGGTGNAVGDCGTEPTAAGH